MLFTTFHNVFFSTHPINLLVITILLPNFHFFFCFQCSEQLTNRRNLIVRDYKVSRTLVKSCREAIKENQCRKSINKDEDPVVKLPKILRCLESALRKGIYVMMAG